MKPISFDKYERYGAYHWKECDRRLANWKSYNPSLEARYRLVADRVRALGGDRLLDIGCGDGYLVGQLAPLVKQAVGIDSEAAAVGFARDQVKGIPNCQITQHGCYDLPFAPESFDVVISTDVIEHLEDAERHLAEIRRVLRADGYLVLTTPKWRPDRKWDERHAKEYRPEELTALIKRHFHVMEMRFFWPLRWSKLYTTRVGWRLIKLLALAVYNPFLNCADTPDAHGQMLVTCRRPKKTESVRDPV